MSRMTQDVVCSGSIADTKSLPVMKVRVAWLVRAALFFRKTVMPHPASSVFTLATFAVAIFALLFAVALMPV